MLLGRHYQNAYVTRDLEASAAQLTALYGVRLRRFEFTIDVQTPAGPATASMKLALGWQGDIQYELVEPVSGHVDFYRDALADDATPRFHHIAMRVDDWDALHAQLEDAGLPIVMEGGSDDLKFLYADARHRLGHYLECAWMTDERWESMRRI